MQQNILFVYNSCFEVPFVAPYTIGWTQHRKEIKLCKMYILRTGAAMSYVHK